MLVNVRGKINGEWKVVQLISFSSTQDLEAWAAEKWPDHTVTVTDMATHIRPGLDNPDYGILEASTHLVF